MSSPNRRTALSLYPVNAFLSDTSHWLSHTLESHRDSFT